MKRAIQQTLVAFTAALLLRHWPHCKPLSETPQPQHPRLAHKNTKFTRIDCGLSSTRNRPIMRSSILCLCVLLLRAACALAAEAPPRCPLLLANYYCWYHNGQHPKRPFLHWTYPASANSALAKQAKRPGEPPPNSVLRPLAGLYDSADPKVAEWHVQLAKAAGVDAFLVDWWDLHNGLDQNVDRGIVAAAGRFGFKFALLDERAQFHRRNSRTTRSCSRGG